VNDDTLADSLCEAIGQTHTLTLGALPLLHPILDTLSLRGIVNDLRPTKANVDLGLVALVLVLNRLMAPQPSCWVNRWLRQMVLPAALDLSLAKMCDQRLGRALQALYPSSPSRGRRTPDAEAVSGQTQGESWKSTSATADSPPFDHFWRHSRIFLDVFSRKLCFGPGMSEANEQEPGARIVAQPSSVPATG
jgi:hypothetical protein